MVKCFSSSVTIRFRMVLKGSFGDDQQTEQKSSAKTEEFHQTCNILLADETLPLAFDIA